MVDADGASRFEDLELLWKEMDDIEVDGQAIAVGSRAHLVGTDAVVKVLFPRATPSFIATHHLYAIAVVHPESFDAWPPFLFKNPRCWTHTRYTMRLQGRHAVVSVCPFLFTLLPQLFSRESAQLLFPTLHISHWIFDVELLLLARVLNIPVAEVAIAWHEVEGSKINLVTDSIGMLRDLIVLRANYAMGRWTIRRRQKQD
jgi:dolichyl-phosphate beta-glucosyltransferase